jgi:hypothetical protein
MFLSGFINSPMLIEPRWNYGCDFGSSIVMSFTSVLDSLKSLNLRARLMPVFQNIFSLP